MSVNESARKIILDTETTGLLAEHEQHRVIEIACVLLGPSQKAIEDRSWLLDPERDIDPGATEVHGYRREDLQGKPKFRDIVAQWYEYVRGAELIIHNAPFDIGMLNSELERLDGDYQPIDEVCTIVDTVILARRKFPGRKVNLDALCNYFQIDTSSRTLHSAIVDCKLLLSVYKNLCGQQSAMDFDAQPLIQAADHQQQQARNLNLRVQKASDCEHQAHKEWFDKMQEQDIKPIWSL